MRMIIVQLSAEYIETSRECQQPEVMENFSEINVSKVTYELTKPQPYGRVYLIFRKILQKWWWKCVQMLMTAEAKRCDVSHFLHLLGSEHVFSGFFELLQSMYIVLFA